MKSRSNRRLAARHSRGNRWREQRYRPPECGGLYTSRKLGAAALALTALLAGLPARAAPLHLPGAAGREPYLDLSAVENGWQPNTVTAVLQTQDGYLWLGTYNGLLRYDGVRFTVFDSGNTPDCRTVASPVYAKTPMARFGSDTKRKVVAGVAPSSSSLLSKPPTLSLGWRH